MWGRNEGGFAKDTRAAKMKARRKEETASRLDRAVELDGFVSRIRFLISDLHFGHLGR